MAKDINVLIDTSGSMAEDCKNAAVKYLLNTIASYTAVNVKNYYLVGGKCEKADAIDGLKIAYAGQISVNAVNEYFREVVEGKTLLISDGCFDVDTERAISKHRDKVVCVAIGEDAMQSNLQHCSKNNRAYLAEDIIAAMSAC
ncbi:VWA domain-containing protein [Pseudobutyrivibrio xylanivorans]|uniref:VWA domain-containing protein n=1 Tax=Pseudobutyrivibrio xylanivorans TaxID=185007 RepID=A0A5P6VRL1_PSEXY|nr:VWA domain-containing protein [Pseudobutyrivibrio xylanivorans]QFJ55277.1 VWA domain-containing protein [Pseudobutyrivibrio xylanivorans]